MYNQLQEWASMVGREDLSNPTILFNTTQSIVRNRLVGRAVDLGLNYLESTLVKEGEPYRWKLAVRYGNPYTLFGSGRSFTRNGHEIKRTKAHGRIITQEELDTFLRNGGTAVLLYAFPGISADVHIPLLDDHVSVTRYGNPVVTPDLSVNGIKSVLGKVEEQFIKINEELPKAFNDDILLSTSKTLPYEYTHQHFK